MCVQGNRDEMSNPTIPQREYEELLKELFGDLPDLNVFDYEEGNEKSAMQQNTDPHPYDTDKSLTNVKNPNENYTFQPTLMSTPLAEVRHKTFASPASQTAATTSKTITNVHNAIDVGPGACITYAVNPTTFSPLSCTTVLPIVPNLTNNQSPTSIRIPLPQLNPYHSAVLKDGIVQLPQFQQFLVTVPTCDILKSQQIQIDNSPLQTSRSSDTLPPSLQDSGLKKTSLQRRNFEYLKNEVPDHNVSLFMCYN